MSARNEQYGGDMQDWYKDLLSYDPATGKFIWLVNASSKAMAGSEAGWLDKEGYRCITIKGKKIKLHRLAWWWMTEQEPPKDMFVDHINRINNDNRFANLRLATPRQSSYNRGKQSNNKSGKKGVFYTKSGWASFICVDGKRICLGFFADKDKASTAYELAAQQMHKEFYYAKSN